VRGGRGDPGYFDASLISCLVVVVVPPLLSSPLPLLSLPDYCDVISQRTEVERGKAGCLRFMWKQERRGIQ